MKIDDKKYGKKFNVDYVVEKVYVGLEIELVNKFYSFVIVLWWVVGILYSDMLEIKFYLELGIVCLYINERWWLNDDG